MSVSDRRLVVDRGRLVPSTLEVAAGWLRAGGIVAYPTDTYYGLAVDPCSPDAAQGLFDLKGRDAGMALPLVAASRDQVEEWCGALTGLSARLATSFWPGPLSLVLDAPASVAREVHAGRFTIAIRVPADPVACALSEIFGRPVTATSANASGAPPASMPEDLAWLQADPRVLIVDAGSAPGGQPSTIVDARAGELWCVRAGAIAWERVLTSR